MLVNDGSKSKIPVGAARLSHKGGYAIVIPDRWPSFVQQVGRRRNPDSCCLLALGISRNQGAGYASGITIARVALHSDGGAASFLALTRVETSISWNPELPPTRTATRTRRHSRRRPERPILAHRHLVPPHRQAAARQDNHLRLFLAVTEDIARATLHRVHPGCCTRHRRPGGPTDTRPGNRWADNRPPDDPRPVHRRP